MPATISLVMFCSNAGSNANAPGKGTPNLQFQLPPKSDKVDDDNVGVFADPSNRGASLNLVNVPTETMAIFQKNPRVRVTIEVIEEGK